MRKAIDDGLTKGPHSVRLAKELMNEADRLEMLELAEEHEVWTSIKRLRKRELKEAMSEGRGTEHILPHPDDIILIRGERAKIDGPVNEGELKDIKRLILQRTALLVEDALWRARDKRRKDYSFDRFGPAFLALMLNKSLPPRFRWSDDEFMFNRQNLLEHSERELSKKRRHAWECIGVRVVRDERLFPRNQTEALMSAAMEVFDQMLDEDLSEKEIAELLGMGLRRRGVRITGDV